MKTTSLFALTGLALTATLMADQPLIDAVEIEPVEIKPEIAICRMPAPISPMKKLKDMEANGDAIESIVRNEKLKTTIEKLKAPIVIGSMEDAAKYLTRASMEKIEVDFNTHQLVVFAWQGSGQDRLNGHLSRAEGAAAQFYYHPGRTEDLRTHSTVYTMPKGTKVDVREQRVIRCGVGLKQVEPQIIPDCDLQVIPMPEGGKIELKIQPLKKAE